MLATYRTATNSLLQNPGAPTSLYDPTSIDRFINTARGQVAGEAECIRFLGTVSATVGQRNYNFSAINTGVSATNGISGVINVRSVMVGIASGYQWLTPRSWPWFQLYHMNTVVPQNGQPTVWSQFGQGAAPGGSGSDAGGSFYLDPPPNISYTLQCDCVCFPIVLVDDNTVEAIPYLWTDAVSYFAAYLALLSAQVGVRTAEAQRMFELYTMFVERARKFSNPSVNRHLYAQSVDPTTLNKLGMQNKVAGGG